MSEMYLVMFMLVPVVLSMSAIEEVSLGDTAVLKCPSNDDKHRFQFWQIAHDQMIGPTNPYDRIKYKYDVLTGTLTIRSVSSSEHGLYSCISKHIDDESFVTASVELVVKRDWEEVYETDHLANVFRISLLVGVLLVLIVLVLILYNMSTDRSARFRALDEESPDEPGVSHREVADNSLSEHVLDTELPRPAIFTDVRLHNTGI